MSGILKNKDIYLRLVLVNFRTMSRRILFLCLLGLMFGLEASGQVPSLYGLRCEMPDSNMPSVGYEQFVSINSLNGTVTVIDTIDGVEGIGLGSSTFDQVNQEYIFWGINDQQQYKLYRLDAQTGTVLNNPPLSSYPLELEFDMNTGGLYGLNNTGSAIAFTSVDLMSGALQSLSSVSVAEFATYSTSTLDATLGTYYFIGGNTGQVSRLYGLDLDSGLVVSQPAISYPAIELEYDQTQNMIYGLAWNKYVENFQLIQIHPFSGAISIVMVVPDLAGTEAGVLSGSSVFHQESQTYMFIGVEGNKQKLYSLDVVNGIHLSSPELSKNNIVELQVDNTSFAAARYGRTNAVSYSQLTGISAFPTPTNGWLKVESEVPLQKDASIFILDSKGSLITQTSWPQGSLATELNLQSQPDGLYLIEVVTEQGRWNTKVVLR